MKHSLPLTDTAAGRLEELISSYQKKYTAQVSVSLVRGGRKFDIGGDIPHPAASLIKLFVLGAALSLIQKNRLSYRDVFGIGAADFAGGSGLLKYAKRKMRFRLRDLLYLMMFCSDNIAANIILARVSIDETQSFIDALGAVNTQIKVPMMASRDKYGDAFNMTTANDVVLFLDAVVRGDAPPGCFDILAGAARNRFSFLRFLFSAVNLKLAANILLSNPAALPQYFLTALAWNRRRLAGFLPPGMVLAAKSGSKGHAFHDAGVFAASPDPTIVAALVSTPGADYTDRQSAVYADTRILLAGIGKETVLG